MARPENGPVLSEQLPALDREDFARALASSSSAELDPVAIERLWIHYGELRRWNRRFSLVGPGTFDEALSRHYAESLAALDLFRNADRTLVDVGTGAGFPGFVLAAARPDLDTTLVEAKRKKWSFLSLVCEKTALPCKCLDARVISALAGEFPQRIDVVATRAVKLSGAEIDALSARLSPEGRFLAWCGQELPEGMAGFRVGRAVPIERSQHRRVVEVFPDTRETG